METTEEHKVLRPIERAKIHKSHTVTDKGPSHGKNWSSRASWRGGHVPKFAMRQQRKDVSPKHTHFLKDRKLRNAGGPKLLGLYARDAQVRPYLEQQNLGELTTAEHKVFLI